MDRYDDNDQYYYDTESYWVEMEQRRLEKIRIDRNEEINILLEKKNQKKRNQKNE